jgi:hypothetical protein
LVQNAAITNKEWWLCIPKISFASRGTGCIELCWDQPDSSSLELISHYQIFLNKVSYKNYISKHTNRVLIKGLAGGRNYDVNVMVFPNTQTLLPQQSNILVFNLTLAIKFFLKILSKFIFFVEFFIK